MPQSPPVPIYRPAGFTDNLDPTYYGATPYSPDSGAIEIGQKNKYQEIIEGTYTSCYSRLLARGSTATILGGSWILASCRLTREKAGKGRIERNWESAVYLPPDSAGLQPENLNPRIERHPLFAALTPDDFATVQSAVQAWNQTARAAALSSFGNLSNPNLANSLYTKLRNGEETYYLSAQRYTWTTYFAYPVTGHLNPGGYAETPGGPFINNLPYGFAWLRESDSMDFVSDLQTMVKLTRSWLGAPNGQWDPDLYPIGSGSA